MSYQVAGELLEVFIRGRSCDQSSVTSFSNLGTRSLIQFLNFCNAVKDRSIIRKNFVDFVD